MFSQRCQPILLYQPYNGKRIPVNWQRFIMVEARIYLKKKEKKMHIPQAELCDLSDCTCGLMPVRNLPVTKPPAPGAGSYGWKHGNDFPEGISGGRRPSSSIWPNRQEICRDSFYMTRSLKSVQQNIVRGVCVWERERERVRDFASINNVSD